MRQTHAGRSRQAAVSRDASSVAAVRAAAVAAIVALLVACGGGGGYGMGPSTGGNNGGNSGGDTGGTGSAVTVVNNAFSPSSLTVPSGTAVTWQWSSQGVAHNVTFDDGQTSGDRTQGSYQRTFSAAGRYDYHCTIHGLSMSGSVVVQ